MMDNPTPLEQIAQLCERLAAEARRQDQVKHSLVGKLNSFKWAAKEQIVALFLQLMA